MLAGRLVTLLLAGYWEYLRSARLIDTDSLMRQHQRWVAMGLTQNDYVYLSKQNLNFTGSIDLLDLPTQFFNQIMGDSMSPSVLLPWFRSAIPALNSTELIRVVVHCGNTDLGGEDFASVSRNVLYMIAKTGIIFPTASRVEIVFKGNPCVRHSLSAVLSTTTAGNPDDRTAGLRAFWNIQTSSDWAATYVDFTPSASDSTSAHGLSFALLDSRFGLRFEQE